MATCPECGAVGPWILREHQTLGGRLECIDRQAAALGEAYPEIAAEVDITRAIFALHRDRVLGLPTPGLDY